ncbi:M81 family metallopeptidase [Pandoraea sp. NPDC090278]|uniref:M81 family metallopeptidase n=1 Tax=Pandoraea sp. NPDC090278 TaxID=3364391 RepID=UPI00383ADBD4
MRIFVASMAHETNSFSPIPTSLHSFEERILYRPEGGVPDARANDLLGYGVFVREARARGHEVVGSLFAFAEPGAPCGKADYETLRDEILRDLSAAGKIDAVLYLLHGAQMAQGYNDCEGDLLAHTRAIVGPDVVIGVELDLHANVTEAMTANCDILLACKYYPHIDFDERAVDLVNLTERAVRREIRPVVHFERVPMLGMFFTTEPRMAEVNQSAMDREGRDGILSVSLIHGFPWSDFPETGAGVLIVTDGQSETVRVHAQDLARRFAAVRDETAALHASVPEILDRIQAAPPSNGRGPFVIADVADNPGGGAGSDSTFILEAVLERGLRNVAVGMLWDPIAVTFARDAGVGAMVRLRLGGKTGPRSGRPLDVLARVVAVNDGFSQHDDDFRFPGPALGLAAVLDIDGVTVVVNSTRQQTYSPSCFTDFGIDLKRFDIVAVKSSQHFRALFGLFAREIFYCETPGSLNLDFRAEDYGNLRRPMWPFDENAI